MTDQLIKTDGTSSGLSTGAAISDTDYLEMQQTVVSPAATVNNQFSAIKTWIKSWIAKADVGLGNVANSLQAIAANNLSDLASAATARTNLGLGSFFGGGVAATGISNVYFTNFFNTSGGGVTTVLRLYMVPIYFPGGTVTTLAVTVTGAAAAGKLGRLGLYNIKADGTPGTLVAGTDTGTFAADATGTKTNSFSAALTAGWYYGATISDGAPTLGGATDGFPCSGALMSGTTAAAGAGGVFRLLGALAALGDESGNTFSPMGVGSFRPIIGLK